MIRKAIITINVLIGLSFFPKEISAQNDIRLQINDIPGSSTLNGYENWIIVENYSLGVQRSLYLGGSQGLRTNGSASTDKLEIAVPINDISIPKLMLAVCNGTVYQSIILAYKFGNLEKEKITLKNAIVDDVKFSIDSNGEGTASISIAFVTIQRELKEANIQGTSSGEDPADFRWNLRTNQPNTNLN